MSGSEASHASSLSRFRAPKLFHRFFGVALRSFDRLIRGVAAHRLHQAVFSPHRESGRPEWLTIMSPIQRHQRRQTGVLTMSKNINSLQYGRALAALAVLAHHSCLSTAAFVERPPTLLNLSLIKVFLGSISSLCSLASSFCMPTGMIPAAVRRPLCI